MTKPITISELKKELKIMNVSELNELILDLYKSSTQVKEILSSKFIGDVYLEEALNTYKRKMLDEMYPRGYRTPSLKNGKSLINDFKKFGDTGSILDLMLYCVELGIRYIVDYGMMNQAFYDGLCRVYGEFIELFNHEGTEDSYFKFKSRIESLLSITCDIGWGLGEYFMDVSGDFFREDEDDEA